MRACSGGKGVGALGPAKRHRVAVRSGCAAGAGQSRPGEPGALEVSGGAADGDGARTPLGGDESRRAPSTGANPGGGGGSATPSPRGRTGPGRAPPEGRRGGWAGLGTGALRPGSRLCVGRRVGRPGRALGLRPGGGRGWRAVLARGRTPRGPRGLGEGPRGRPLLEGGGGGLLPARGTTGGPS